MSHGSIGHDDVALELRICAKWLSAYVCIGADTFLIASVPASAHANRDLFERFKLLASDIARADVAALFGLDAASLSFAECTTENTERCQS